MTATPAVLYLDYVDPVSWMLELELGSAAAGSGQAQIRRAPLELRAPPDPLIDPNEEWWRTRWEEGAALAAARGLNLAAPRLIPWTRKAHELRLHAAEKGSDAVLHRALFQAFLLEGQDIGRVDVLLTLAASAGLDTTESKAVLDVDRHAEAVTAARVEAASFGIVEPPALRVGASLLQGFHNMQRLRTFLCSP